MVVVVGNSGVRAAGFPETIIVAFGKSGLWGEPLASGAGDSGLTCSLALDLVALGLGLQPSLDIGQDTALRGSQTAGSLLSSWSLRSASCRGRLGVLSCFPRPDSLEGEIIVTSRSAERVIQVFVCFLNFPSAVVCRGD